MGGVRPRLEPAPFAILAEARYSADATVAVLDSAVRARGLQISASSPAEGYLETGWFDAVSRSPANGSLDTYTRVVRLRFFVDPVMGRTRVIAECVRRIAFDPSTPERDLERMVPGNHPGRALLDTLISLVSVPGDSATVRRADGPPR